MNAENKPNKFKQFIKKIGTRNLVIICAVLLIGAAVCVNYVVYKNSEPAGDIDVDIDLDGTDLNDVLDNDPNASDYFSQTALSRQQARDEAIEVFGKVLTMQGLDAVLPLVAMKN